jgi:hypothetical protein
VYPGAYFGLQACFGRPACPLVGQNPSDLLAHFRQGCDDVAPANCESFLHLIFDRIGGGRESVCATGHCFDAFFRSELTEGHTPGVTANCQLRRALGHLCFGELDTLVPAYGASILAFFESLVGLLARQSRFC